MSIRVMTLIWEQSALAGTDLLILLALGDNANDEGIAWPSIPRLARKVRMTERGLRYALNRIASTGEVFIEAGGGRGHPSRYHIILPGNCEKGELGFRVENPAIRNTNPAIRSRKGGTGVPINPEKAPGKPQEEPSVEPSIEPSVVEPSVVLALPRQTPKPRQRDYHWDALVHIFGGSPATPMERAAWNAALVHLRAVEPGDLIRAAEHWPNVMGALTMTPHGIAKNLGMLLHGPQINGRSNGVTVGMRHTKAITYSERPDITDSLEQIIRERDQN